MSEETIAAIKAAYAGATVDDVAADLMASRHAQTLGDPRLVATFIAKIANEQ